MATFDNPVFYKNKRLGYSNYYNSSTVYMGMDVDGYVKIPRGLLEELLGKCILEFCTSPKGVLEIADMLGYTQKKSVRKYLKPLVEQGRLAMTIPDRPNSSSQKYVTVR